MEATLDSYKKKLEDMSDLRRQVKLLEERNTEFMQRNMDLEEDVKKTGNWRPQVGEGEIPCGVLDMWSSFKPRGLLFKHVVRS